MTIEELQLKLDSIPDVGVMNKARRRAIIIQINQLMEKQEAHG